MIYVMTEKHPNAGRTNIMQSIAASIERRLLCCKNIMIPRVFGDELIANNGNPTVAKFKEIAGEFFQPKNFRDIIHEAATALEEHLPRIHKNDTPIFVAYYGHPDSVLTGLALKAMFPQTLLVSLGYPYRAVNWFDVIAVPPYHNDIPPHTRNTLNIDAIPSHITPDLLLQAHLKWEKEFAANGESRVTNDDCLIGLLVGGPFPAFAPSPLEARVVGEVKFTAQHARDLCVKALALKKQIVSREQEKRREEKRIDFLITTSRRTPPEVTEIIFEKLGHHARWLHDPRCDGDPNPLMGMLALARYLVVTGDSMSMISDALTTDAARNTPIIVYAPPSLMENPLDVQGVHKNFCNALHADRKIIFLGEPLLDKPSAPISSPAQAIAERIRNIMDSRTRNAMPRHRGQLPTLRLACG